MKGWKDDFTTKNMTLVARSLVIINDVKRIMNVSNFFFFYLLQIWKNK
jgi:hypothetical protein